MKRHKWKKCREKVKFGAVDGYGRSFKVIDIYECIGCGLKKGYTKHKQRWSGLWSGFSTLVYFQNNKILSKNKLPFKCSESNKIFADMFLSEKDMKI